MAAPVYPLAYAATLAGLDANTARRWVRGHAYPYKGERRKSTPVIHVPLARAGAKAGLSFEELLTLRLVRAFREKGLGLPTIKKAAQIAAERYGLANPFVTNAFRSDGRSVFLELKRRRDVKGDDVVLVNALTGQQEFRDIVEPSLFRDVVFVGEMPTQWFPRGREHLVVIRPDRVFGAPHIADTGVRTDVLADAVAAEGGDADAIAAVAAWFKLTENQVREAIAAETEWQMPKAA